MSMLSMPKSTRRKLPGDAGAKRRSALPDRKVEKGRSAIGVSEIFEKARQTALSLDNVEEGTSYGTPAFRVNGELFLRLHQDGESLVVRTTFEERPELLAADPDVYY